jgi:hypothetical protein
MSGLFPIIRRQRRPLVADVPPIPTKTEPVQSAAEKPLVEPAKSAPAKPGRKNTGEDDAKN